MTSMDGSPTLRSSHLLTNTSAPSKTKEEWSPFHPSFAFSLPTPLPETGTITRSPISSTEPSNDAWTMFTSTDFHPLI
jgi:hypothetical protein